VTLPAPLRAGSRIAVVSPAGPIVDRERFECGLDVLRAQQFMVEVVGPLSSRHGSTFLSAPDEARATALRKALRTAEAVWYSRGGYGSARLLTAKGWDLAGAWVVGFSDATAMLWARYARGLSGGVHGPVVNGLGAEPKDSLDRLFAMLTHQATSAISVHHLGGPSRAVSGPVIAGNLAVATSLLGTPHLPDLSGHIVVFEDVAEPAYKVDRMLTQWLQSGALEGVRALVFGTFDAVPNPESYEVIAERTEQLGIPIYTCSRIGHHGEVAALTIGQQVRLSPKGLNA
jgi:muramoyltetrapeptide carboxypeptidase